MPRLCVCFRAYRPYLVSWKCSFSSPGRSITSTAGLRSIRQTSPIVRPGATLVMNSFSPLTTYSSPSSRASVRRAVRSEPAQGSVRAKAAEPLAAGQPGQEPLALLGSAERADRIDRSDAAVDRGQAGHGRLDHRHPREKGGEAGEGGPRSAVLLVDQQAPIAGRAEIAQHAGGNLAGPIHQSARLAVPGDDGSIEASITRCTSGGVVGDWLTNRSTGKARSHTARWIGLLVV